MASRDASVSVLMDRMSELDKQRRVLSMHQKELEAKVAFATTEKGELEREVKAMDNEEAQLKVDLEALATEEQQLELQMMEATDHLRRTEEEEAVHTAAATTEQQALAKERLSWQEKAQELETLRRTWENDPVTSACIVGLREEAEALNTLKAEKAALEEKRTALESAIEKMRVEQQVRLACAGSTTAAAAMTLESLQVPPHGAPSSRASPSSPAVTADAAHATQARSVDEEIKKVEYEWAQITARHTWTMSSLQREVDALSSRATELQDLLANVQTARQEVSWRAGQLQQCLTSGVCARCSS